MRDALETHLTEEMSNLGIPEMCCEIVALLTQLKCYYLMHSDFRYLLLSSYAITCSPSHAAS